MAGRGDAFGGSDDDRTIARRARVLTRAVASRSNSSVYRFSEKRIIRMKKRLFKLLPAAAIALTAIVSQSAVQGAESDVPVESYQLSDGSNCFLVPLQADSIESESEYVDVVALVDFSAA